MKKCFCLIWILFFSSIAILFAADEFTDPSKPIEISEGKDFSIVVASNKTTGYEWQLDGDLDKNIVDFVGSEYIAEEPKMPGSGGKEIWTFRAAAPGKTEILMVYKRPWERDEQDEKKALFTIIVQKIETP